MERLLSREGTRAPAPEAGLLTPGSSLPEPSRLAAVWAVRQWRVSVRSPVTVARPCRISTGFPLPGAAASRLRWGPCRLPFPAWATARAMFDWAGSYTPRRTAGGPPSGPEDPRAAVRAVARSGPGGYTAAGVSR